MDTKPIEVNWNAPKMTIIQQIILQLAPLLLCIGVDNLLKASSGTVHPPLTPLEQAQLESWAEHVRNLVALEQLKSPPVH